MRVHETLTLEKCWNLYWRVCSSDNDGVCIKHLSDLIWVFNYSFCLHLYNITCIWILALFSQRPVNSNTKHSSQRKSDELDLTIQVLEILHCLVWHNIICPSSLNAIFKIVLGEGGTDKLLLYKIPYELNNEVI